MKITIRLIMAIVLLSEMSIAQTFQKSIGRLGSDYPMDMIELLAGGFAVTGTMGNDVFLMKLDSNGDTLWVKTYDHPELLTGSWVAETSGGFIIIGDSHLDISGLDQDIILIRTDHNGNEMWSKTYAGTGKDYGTTLASTPEAYFLAGAVGISQYDTEGIVIKIDLQGGIIWQRAIVGAGAENINAIRALDDGGCIVAGTTNSYFKGHNSIFVTRLNADGETEWSAVYNDGGNCYGFGMDLVENGDGLIISGATDGSGASGYDALLLKINNYNNDPSVAWAKMYGGSDFDTAVKTVSLGDDGFIALGQTYSFGTASDLFLLRASNNGDVTWAKAYGGEGYEFGEGLLALPNGFLIGGGEESFGTDRDVFLVRCDMQGNSGCNEIGCKLSISDSNMQMMEDDNVETFTVVSSEQSFSVHSGAQVNVMCETISVHEEVKSENILYPNPCTQYFTVQGTRSGGKLIVYDAMGKNVYERTTRFGSATVDVSKMSSGVYVVLYTDYEVVMNRTVVKE